MAPSISGTVSTWDSLSAGSSQNVLVSQPQHPGLTSCGSLLPTPPRPAQTAPEVRGPQRGFLVVQWLTIHPNAGMGSILDWRLLSHMHLYQLTPLLILKPTALLCTQNPLPSERSCMTPRYPEC